MTLDSEETVSQFEQKVRDNCDIKEFKVLGGDKDAKVEQVIKRKFQIEVNGKERYDVYPHLEAMVDKPANPKVRAIIDKALEGRSIPISRRVILYHYFDKVVHSLKEKSTGGLTQDEITQTFEKALKEYSKEYAMKIYQGPSEQLHAAEKELSDLIKAKEEIENLSQKHSSRMLYLAFTNCAVQLGGMGYLIFGLYGWEVMESITYMVCKFMHPF